MNTVNLADTMLLSGNEAVALAAFKAGVALGAGYPGTPSTEILENFSKLGGYAQWSPNEKVALEVAIGAAFANVRAIATMKHVGLNVAADPLFTAAYTGVEGALVIVSADDPGMASSQNEQDNRRFAEAAGIPMLEPSDSQEAFDFTIRALETSERWKIPVMLRMTTRICHSKSLVNVWEVPSKEVKPGFKRDIKGKVMVPAFAKLAHRRLRQKLAEIALWNETSGLNVAYKAKPSLGIVSSGIAFMHAREAAPEASILKLGMSYPLPIETVRGFVKPLERCVVIEEGDPFLETAIRAQGIRIEGKPEMYRFGELTVPRVRRILQGDMSPEVAPNPGKPPELCPGCPHRAVFAVLKELDCIVAGDIGCYTLGALEPFGAMDTCVCMGASIGVGLGLRHALPKEQAKRVVSVIGDSTFIHSGITGLIDMVYNKPTTGHVVLILDNGTTAMTGMQEHPGTGRRLDSSPSVKLFPEEIARSMGIESVHVMDPAKDKEAFKRQLSGLLEKTEPAVLIARRECVLVARKNKQSNNCHDKVPSEKQPFLV